MKSFLIVCGRRALQTKLRRLGARLQDRKRYPLRERELVDNPWPAIEARLDCEALIEKHCGPLQAEAIRREYLDGPGYGYSGQQTARPDYVRGRLQVGMKQLREGACA